MSRNARLSLIWDDPEGRPATIVGKFPTDDPSTRASSFDNGAYFSEFAFYNELAATVDVCTPACWVARFDAERPDFVLILEDMAGSVQGDQFAGCSTDQTALAIEQAAALHAPRWGDPTLADAAALKTDGGERGEALDRFFGECAEGCLARLGTGSNPRLSG